jgi:hypothetical protein
MFVILLGDMAFFSSPSTFGLILKLCTSIAAAGFGIFGIGTKTRDDNGRILRNGWIALIGIVVAGLLALATALNDYKVEQAKDKAAREAEQAKSKTTQEINLGVQRGIYPLKGVTLTLFLYFNKTSEIVSDYTKTLDLAIAKDPDVKHAEPFQLSSVNDDGERIYRIADTSSLFPQPGTLMRSGIENSGLTFQLLKRSHPVQMPPSAYAYSNVGVFAVRLGEHVPEHWSLTYRPSNDHLTLRVDNYPVTDSDVRSSGVLSLIDFMPGAMAESATVFLTPFLDTFRKLDFDMKPAIVRMSTFSKAVSSGRVVLKFAFPKEIWIGEPFSVDCKDNGGYLARLLPDTPDAPEVGSGIGLPAPDLSEENKKRLCAALVSTDYVPVARPRH